MRATDLLAGRILDGVADIVSFGPDKPGGRRRGGSSWPA